MNDRGVMLPTKRSADLRKRRLRQFFYQKHSDLPRQHNLLAIAFFLEQRRLNGESFSHCLLDGIDRDPAVLFLQQSLSTCCAIAIVIGVSVSDEYAVSLINAPSSSRTFDLVLFAIN